MDPDWIIGSKLRSNCSPSVTVYRNLYSKNLQIHKASEVYESKTAFIRTSYSQIKLIRRFEFACIR
jgi:hypothetical protein